jgi:hypothetical protein
MGPYAVSDYKLTLSRLLSPLQRIYHGQPYARVDLNPMPESTLTPCQSRLCPLVRELGFGLSTREYTLTRGTGFILAIWGLSWPTSYAIFSISCNEAASRTTYHFKALLSLFSCFMTPANPRNECKTHYLARNGCANPSIPKIYVLYMGMLRVWSKDIFFYLFAVRCFPAY